MTADLRTALITLLISSIVAPLVLLIVNRLFSKKHDTTDYAQDLQKIANQAVADLRTAEERYRDLELRYQADMLKFQKKLSELEAAISGPFLVKLEIVARPSPRILASSIELIGPVNGLKKTNGPPSPRADKDTKPS